MSNKSKLLLGIAIGAAAGTAIILLFNTEAGKEMLSQIRSGAAKALQDWVNADEDKDQPATAV